MADPAIEQLQNQLIDMMKQKGSLDDSRIEATFRAVPRHLFLPDVSPDLVYTDEALPIDRHQSGRVLSSCSQPSMIATMLAQLRLEPGHNVLEIGAGTGYNAALIQSLSGAESRVTTIELDKDMYNLARDNFQRLGVGSRINLVNADGAMGYAPRASYDRIIASVSIWDVPAAWKQQLKPGGILVAPIWLDSLQVSAAFRQQADGSLTSEENVPCGFVSLRGPAAGPNMYRRVETSALMLASFASARLDTAALHWLLSDDEETNYLGYPLTAADYWNGFLPYFMLNLPSGYSFGLYSLINDQPAYGLDDHGFALISQGSACFVPYRGLGNTMCFAGSDAFMVVQSSVAAWDDTGRVTADRLRLRLTPAQQGTPSAGKGRIYARHDHFLHVWLEQ
jgi:protein-L-isoaspartate(D-aspartate) O-methyltransferase